MKNQKKLTSIDLKVLGGDIMICEFEDRCNNADVNCEFCQYNLEACTQDFFEWNGEGEEPTQDELDDAICS